MAGHLFRCGHWKVRWTCRDCSTEWEDLWRCHLRVCPRCARDRGRRLFAEYGDLCDQPGLKHLVLTVPNVQHLTRGAISDLRSNFRRLRRRKRFRRAWRGGLYSIEMTFSRRTRWHVHIHVLIEGGYVPQAQIREAWEEICGGQRVVWIQASRNSREVLKYILKPGRDLLGDLGAIREFIEATRNNRLTHSWGSWYSQGVRIEKRKPECPDCGSTDVAFDIVPSVIEPDLGPRGPPGCDLGVESEDVEGSPLAPGVVPSPSIAYAKGGSA